MILLRADSLELILPATLWCFAYQRIPTPHQGCEFRGVASFNKITKNQILVHRFWSTVTSTACWVDATLALKNDAQEKQIKPIQVHLQDLRCSLQVDPMLAEQLAGNTLAPLAIAFSKPKKRSQILSSQWASDDWPSWHQNAQTSANLTRPKYKNCVWQLRVCKE